MAKCLIVVEVRPVLPIIVVIDFSIIVLSLVMIVIFFLF